MDFVGRFFNPAVNDSNLRSWCKQPKIFSSFGMIRTRAKPFLTTQGNQFVAPALGRYTAIYNAAKCAVMEVRDPELIAVSAVCELLSPLMPTVKLQELSAARLRTVGCALRIIKEPGCLASVLKPASLGDLLNDLRQHITQQRQWSVDILPEEQRISLENLSASTAGGQTPLPFGTAHKLIWYLTAHCKETIDTLVTKSVVVLLVAISKQGVASTQFCQKIATGVAADIGVEIDLEPDEIRAVYNIFGRYVTGKLARLMIFHLINLLGDKSLRLMLTLNQAAGSGLTVFCLIIEMVKAHPNFKWQVVFSIAANEKENLNAAITEVNNDLWFGYNSDKQHASTAKLPTLFFTAKSLAIKAEGQNTWNRYRGARTGVKNIQAIDDLVDSYIANREEKPASVADFHWNAVVDQALMTKIREVNMTNPPLTEEETAMLNGLLAQHVIPDADQQHGDDNSTPAAYLLVH